MKNRILYLVLFVCLIVGAIIVRPYIGKLNATKTDTPSKDSIVKAIVNPIIPEEKNVKFNSARADSISIRGANGAILGILDITPENLVKAFGKPISKKTEFSEVEDANVVVYKYKGARFTFLKGNSDGIEITDKGFSFLFKRANRSSSTFNIGDKTQDLYKAFPHSWNGEPYGDVSVDIQTTSGEMSDVSVIFNVKKSTNHKTIQSMGIYN